MCFHSKHIISYVIARISCGNVTDPLAEKTDGTRFVFMHELGCCEIEIVWHKLSQQHCIAGVLSYT
jgi:hypothetical protein